MTRSIAGFRTARHTPERVLANAGLTGRTTLTELVTASAPFDKKNPGYLSEDELTKGAASLRPAARDDGLRFSGRILAGVQGSVLRPNDAARPRFSADEILNAARGWDDGNGYLNKKELSAGAYELQARARSGELSAADIAAIQQMVGVTTSPVSAQPVSLDDLTSNEARAVLARRVPNLDTSELESAADEVIDNREGSRTRAFTWSIEEGDNGSLEVTLSTDFDYEGTEFSHYTSFSVAPNGDYDLTDAGAD